MYDTIRTRRPVEPVLLLARVLTLSGRVRGRVNRFSQPSHATLRRKLLRERPPLRAPSGHLDLSVTDCMGQTGGRARRGLHLGQRQ
eukprot:276176-Prymnesium_polylepis.2